ncbi:MAG: hypothetical protein QOE17_2558, partial [Gaiellales bacterium]|nr:hypothetical protein [Gaiellales bacterium]
QNNIINGNVFGIYANSNSTFQNAIRTNNIRFNNVGFGVNPASGNGIYTDQGTDRLLIARNAIRGQQNSGILLTGTDVPFTENRNVTIQNNQAVNNSTFVNMFRNNTNIQIRQNTTNDTIVDDNVDQGTAIRIADNANGVVVSNNTIRNSPFSGVAVRDMEFSSFNPDNIDIQFNRILSPEGNGVDVTDERSGAVSVFKNTIRHADLDGIVFSELTQNNFINSNSATFSGDFDCQDFSHDGTGTDGTSNTWTNNVGPVADPGGICHN